jgi:hypothetical protein
MGAGERRGMARRGRAGAMALTLALAVPLTLGACATADAPADAMAKPAHLHWDYERDGLGISENDRKGRMLSELARSNLFGSLRGASPLDNIELSPGELQAAIVSALAPPRHFLSAVPRSSTVRTSLAPESTAAPPADRTADGDERGWGIASSNEGQITTDWQRIPGREAGVLWWKKRYDTEVRHVITVKQAFRSSSLSSYSIETEVRERPNANYDWAPANPELGRASFERIKGQLWVSIQTQSNRKKARK